MGAGVGGDGEGDGMWIGDAWCPGSKDQEPEIRSGTHTNHEGFSFFEREVSIMVPIIPGVNQKGE